MMCLAKGYKISDEKPGAVSLSTHLYTHNGHPDSTLDLRRRTNHLDENIDIIKKHEDNVLNALIRPHEMNLVSLLIGRFQGFCSKGILLTEDHR